MDHHSSARRPNRSAASRRAQYARAQFRAAEQLLKAYSQLQHRGCRPTLLGDALAAALEQRIQRARQDYDPASDSKAPEDATQQSTPATSPAALNVRIQPVTRRLRGKQSLYTSAPEITSAPAASNVCQPLQPPPPLVAPARPVRLRGKQPSKQFDVVTAGKCAVIHNMWQPIAAVSRACLFASADMCQLLTHVDSPMDPDIRNRAFDVRISIQQPMKPVSSLNPDAEEFIPACLQIPAFQPAVQSAGEVGSGQFRQLQQPASSASGSLLASSLEPASLQAGISADTMGWDQVLDDDSETSESQGLGGPDLDLAQGDPTAPVSSLDPALLDYMRRAGLSEQQIIGMELANANRN